MMHSAIQLRQQLESGALSSVELTESCLSRIAQQDGQVGAFLTLDAEGALAQAAAIDDARRAGQPLGPLAGIPVALKDNICVDQGITSCASKIVERFAPPYNATVVERLRGAGAVLLGKTNLDEFAMGSSTENSALQKTRNPWDLRCVPGGSSGGSAAAVAADMVPLALGSDTGGSIRQPASFCGVVGLKPTYGRVSRYGLVAFASSLDQIGPFARTAEDAALLLSAMGGHDPLDSTSANQPIPPLVPLPPLSLDGVKLGIVRDQLAEGVSADVAAAVRDAIEIFKKLGATTVDIELPHSQYAIATYYIIAPSEASSNLARFDGAHYGYRIDESDLRDELENAASAGMNINSPLIAMYCGTRARGFGPEVKRRIMIGTYALSAGYYDAFYLKALKVRRLIRDDFDRAFGQVDAILGPVTPSVAFRAGEKVDDPLEMYLSDLFTVGSNLAGIPAISIPCGISTTGLPIGLHLQGGLFTEQKLLQLAAAFQSETDWHQRRPELS